MRQVLRNVFHWNDLDGGAVLGSQLARDPLPPELKNAARVPDGFDPVGDTGVLLADHHPDHPVRIHLCLAVVEGGLMIDVVE